MSDDQTPPPEPDNEPDDTEPDAATSKGNEDWQSEARRKGRENSSLRKRIKEIEAENEAMKTANMSEVEKQLAEAEARGRAAAAEEFTPRLRQLILSDAARGRLIEPELASSLVGPDVDLDDPRQVAAAVDDIVKRYPRLAVGEEGGSPQAPQQQGSFDQGPRGNVTKTPSTNDMLMDALGFGKKT